MIEQIQLGKIGLNKKRTPSVAHRLLAVTVLATFTASCGGSTDGSDMGIPPPVGAPAPTPPPSSTPPVAAWTCTARDAVRYVTNFRVMPLNGTVRIVVVGSSSTAGVGATSQQNGYVAVLQRLLNARTDLASFQLINKGVSGDSLAKIEARLQRDVLDENPQLVVLQTGTNDAIIEPNVSGASEFGGRLRSVVAKIRVQSPVIIINGQYYPALPANYQLYMSTIQQTAIEQDVPLFDRFGLMKSQVDSGQYTFSSLLAPDNLHPNEFSHDCMGSTLSDLIVGTIQRVP